MSAVLDQPAPDFAAIKQRQQATWASGDFAVVGTTLQIVGETLAEAADVRAGERVLDVAAGNGNATLAAARRFAARDLAPTTCRRCSTRAAPRAQAEGLRVSFQVADAEALPFADAQLRRRAVDLRRDVRARPRSSAASEMLRVVRPGGRIGMANWTPEGFIGQLFKRHRRATCRRRPG